jgi:predicted secreted protein
LIPGIVHGDILISAFAILWFLALFCLFPIGLGDVDPQTGAPLKPHILRKMGIATVIAAVLWAIFYVLILLKVVEL